MEIDNFKQVRKYLEYNEGYVYMLFILRRGKDHQNDDSWVKYEPRVSHFMKYFLIESAEDLDKIENEVKLICKDTQSRANLCLNAINKADLENDIKTYISEHPDAFMTNRVFFDIAQEPHKSDIFKYQYLDLDEEFSSDENIEKYSKILTERCGTDVKILDIVPTPSGKHLLVSPFDKDAYYNYVFSLDNNVPVVKYGCIFLYSNLNDQENAGNK